MSVFQFSLSEFIDDLSVFDLVFSLLSLTGLQNANLPFVFSIFML